MIAKTPISSLIVGIATLGIAAAFQFCPMILADNLMTTFDAGGGRATSAAYTMDGSLGGLGDPSSNAAPLETARNGFIGQLFEVTSITVTAMPYFVSELSNCQLSAMAKLDDSSVLALSGSDMSWNEVTYPLASISSDGVATPANVYAATPGTAGGYYLGVTGSGALLVLDSNPDDYGSYADDGLPDRWQVQYFGLNNPKAAPDVDADSTGQDNLFKFVAGLDPTNPASVFVSKIASAPNQSAQQNLFFNPMASGRTYTLLFSTDLTSGDWLPLTGYAGPVTNGNQIAVTDMNAIEPQKFYRIRIAVNNATDVSFQISVIRGGFRYDTSTQKFVQTVTLRNIGSTVIASPLALVLDSLSANALLVNANGVTALVPPLGSPFISVNLGVANVLAPGATVPLTLEFANSTNGGITYTTRVLSGTGY